MHAGLSLHGDQVGALIQFNVEVHLRTMLFKLNVASRSLVTEAFFGALWTLRRLLKPNLNVAVGTYCMKS